MKPGTILKVLREYGVQWAMWRAAYGLAMKAGYFRRGLHTGQDPVRVLMEKMGAPDGESAAWLANRWVESRGAFFLPAVDAARGLARASRVRILTRADAVLQGEYLVFSTGRELGFPPDWFQGQEGYPAWPHDRHWSRIADLAVRNGDIKHVWELSRFSHAYDLCRAYQCSGEEKYAQGFWDLCASWWAANPLEIGVNWRCGQEMSFRVLAWTFALYALENSRASTPDRVGTLIAHLWHHGRHVDKVNWYAERCVRNNHAISEAVALRTLGVLFPFLPEAGSWKDRGRRNLAREITWQIYADGTYVQQSNIYARLVVQLLTWALRLEQENGTDPSGLEILSSKAGLLVDQLLTQINRRDGQLPNYGANDGTLIFPWTACDYRDFRPALHALSLTLGRKGLPGDGPWGEEAFWFGLSDAAGSAYDETEVPDGPSLHTFPVGGLNVMRGTDSLVFFRCGPSVNRPVEADMLHVDYWYKGVNVLLDAGTFGYNVPGRARGYFAGTRSHNTVTVDGADQMRRGDRFLWHDWVQGVLESHTAVAGEMVLAGRHEGYRPVVHQRSVRLKNNCVLVVDDLFGGTGESDFRLHWLMRDLPRQDLVKGVGLVMPDGEPLAIKVWCDSPVRHDIVRNQPDEPRGVWSPNYGVMAPAWSLAVEARATQVRFVTFAGPAAELAKLVDPDHTRPAETAAAVLESWRCARTSGAGNDLN